MNDVRPDKSNGIVCYCSGTTEAQVQALINEGVDNLDRISRITGACSGCGSCDASLMALLAEAGVASVWHVF